mgnify:CR=1 FL=1
MIQEQMLSKILNTKDSSIITLNNLGTDYFSDYATEFNFIKNHLNQYGNIPDPETFLSRFPDFDYMDVKEPLNYLLEELTRDKNKRFLANNYNKVREAMLNNRVEEALQILQQASEQSGTLVSLQATNLLENTSRYDNYLDKVGNQDKYFIKTGFPELDKITGGWDVNEDLVTIVARNGVGKSWVLLKSAAAATEQGKKVGIYSGEMSEDSVGYRVDTLLGHISNGALVHGSGSVKNQYRNFLDKLNNIKGSLYVLTPKQINGPATVSALRAFIEKYDLDILFVDQHSLLEDERGAKNPVEKASNISKDLKLLQTVKRIPVICVSQQNREKLEDGKTFDTTQVAQSDRIAQDSSQIIFLSRKDDLMQLHLIKSRQSGSGEVLTYRIDLNNGYFTYVPDEKDLNSDNNEVVDSEGIQYSEEDVF